MSPSLMKTECDNAGQLLRIVPSEGQDFKTLSQMHKIIGIATVREEQGGNIYVWLTGKAEQHKNAGSDLERKDILVQANIISHDPWSGGCWPMGQLPLVQLELKEHTDTLLLFQLER